MNPSNWTADFRIARALSEAYKASGFQDVLFVCVGHPEDPIARLGPLVADETIKYYGNVVGTTDAPARADEAPERVREALERWPGRFVIGIGAGYGLPEHLGSIEITDRGLSAMASDSPVRSAWSVDVAVNVVLWVDDFEVGRRRAAHGETLAGAPAPSEGLRQATLEIGSDDEVGGKREKFRPLLPEQITPAAVQKLADTVIDGNLRFLSKIGKQRI